MTDYDELDARVHKILGDEDEQADIGDSVNRYIDHLVDSLQLPCTVTGSEDFNWEEFYVIGPGAPDAYERLRVNAPSYQDHFDLLSIEKDVISEWMMFDEDIVCHVRRQSDGKLFYLGLAEIEAVDKDSKNHQLLNDYAVWFVNNR